MDVLVARLELRQYDFKMHSFLCLALSVAAISNALAAIQDNSPSCSTVGGDDNGNGLAVTCITDSPAKSIPFPNLARAVNGLTVFSSNASADVNVDAASVESLTYRGNSAEIPDNAFSAFKGLRDLTIDFSQEGAAPAPVNLKSNAFKGLEWTLKRLVLIGINLGDAGGFPAAIRTLSALQTLQLDDCRLKGQLKGADLQQLKNLRSLLIDNSPELSIADDAFSNNAENLEKVALNQVQMKTIPKSASSLKSLTEFQAKSTGLTALPAVFQSSGSTLKELSLRSNAISRIDAGAFKGLSALTVLTLSGNQISALPSGLFDDLVSLETLDLNANRLTTASTQNAFTNLKSLKRLSVGENQLDGISPNTLAGIENSATVLYFSGNKIKTVKGTSKLTQSPQLLLASNGIDSLAPGTIESGSSFSELVLDSNPITSIQAGVFNNVAVGRVLDIDDTALTELDLSSLSGLKGVQNLTVSNNADLRTLKVSSDSAVPPTLKYVIFDNNGRLVLSDADGQLGAYLRKSGARLIFKNKVYCGCQMAWLRDKWPKGTSDRKAVISFTTDNEYGETTPTQCCNVDDTSVEDFLSDRAFTQQCSGGAGKGNSTSTDDDTC